MFKWSQMFCAVVFIAFAAQGARADLIGFYPLNGNTSDFSGYAANVSAASGVGYVSGYEGLAGSFNGSSSYLSVPININPAAMPEVTMGAWVLPDNVSGIRGIISQDNGGFDRNLNIDYRGCAGSTCYSAFTGAGVLPGSAALANPLEWVFVAASYNGSTGAIKLYVDGNTFATTGIPGSGWSYTQIGHNPSFGEWFSGKIDNVFFFNEALSDAEVSSIRSGGADALLAYAAPPQVPEPTSLLLLGSGLGVLGFAPWRRRK